MQNISQTENEVKISIKINGLKTQRPSLVTYKNFIKFNCPPVYFEAFLTDEIDEDQSTCKLLKKEAILVLVKKYPGLWEEIIEDVPKAEALRRKIEIDEQLRLRTKEQDHQRSIDYENKKRESITRQIERDTKRRDFVEKLDKKICTEEVSTLLPAIEAPPAAAHVEEAPSKPRRPKYELCEKISVPVRRGGKINIQLSKFPFRTPKRENAPSQGVPPKDCSVKVME